MANKITPIDHFGIFTHAPHQELLVNFNKRNNIYVGVVVLVAFGFLLLKSLDSTFFIVILLLMAAAVLSNLIYNQRKPNPWLRISKEGVAFYGAEICSWQEVSDIVHEDDDEGKGTLLITFKYHTTESITLEGLDQSLDTIAAYINKYWQRSWE